MDPVHAHLWEPESRDCLSFDYQGVLFQDELDRSRDRT
ncbi:hypothetical protein KIPB_013675, partial [Kipferlia bialata]|eukprot:g13675.t1